MSKSDFSFNIMPSVNISRSRFRRTNQHKTSFNLGQIIPIYLDEVLPGDTRSIDLAALVRMSTPIAPIMDNIYLDLFAFFVPNRLVWDHWKAFIGENETGAGIPSVNYTIPHIQLAGTSSIGTGSYGDYFGLPIKVSGIGSSISALPFRGLAKIYNRWFRNQNLIAPLAVNTSDTDGVLIGEINIANMANSSTFVLKASKLPDYFTKALPFAQKGAAVQIPIGTTAPIISSGSPLTLSGLNASNSLSIFGSGTQTQSGARSTMEINNPGQGVSPSGPLKYTGGLVADLSQATAATINQLRYAFQLQKFLEKDALYGSRYWEILAAHFGILAPDATLQDPEYLGGQRMRINIDQVLSTAGYTDDSGTDLGKPGANSVSAFKGSIFTKSFVEHGYIFILAVARHEQTYSQGINRMWSRNNRYDFYWPVFANLGAQDLKLKEIYAQGTTADDNIFGYQEAWAEYRFKPSFASGLLRPQADNSLNYWTLTNNFGSAPTLSKSFVEQGRDNLVRALSTADTGPDFIADFYFEDVAVRPMPMFSIPGLIDHH